MDENADSTSLNLDSRSSPARRFQNGGSLGKGAILKSIKDRPGSLPRPLHFELVSAFLPTILHVGGTYT